MNTCPRESQSKYRHSRKSESICFTRDQIIKSFVVQLVKRIKHSPPLILVYNSCMAYLFRMSFVRVPHETFQELLILCTLVHFFVVVVYF